MVKIALCCKSSKNVAIFLEEKYHIEDTINNYAFAGGTCPNPTDPLIIHLRIKSNNQDVYKKLAATELATEIKALMASYGVHPHNLIVDSDGVGGPVADMLKGTNFVNNSKALHDQNFSNLKSQCYVKLSEMFKEGSISLNILEPSIIDDLTQELLAVKLKDVDKDGKVAVQSKDDMKKILGRSPDISDCMMMGMMKEIKNLKSTGRYAIAFV